MRGILVIRYLLLLLSILAASPVLHADSDYDTARKLREAGDILPLETILHKLEQSHPGKVLEVEVESEHGRMIYEIELLETGGKVRKFLVDPRTGDIVRQKTEH